MNKTSKTPENCAANISRGVVRFITAGSVDDGKSTLIGRLLYDSKAILIDQIKSLAKSKHVRVKPKNAEFDLALLTDGLEAEREQGITIDVAYRYFSTPERKFIVADAPGHEQYTRNLVTGASQSDVAIVLVDASRVDFSHSPARLLAQTKRHSSIIHLLGIRQVAFAVNKMDLLNFDEEVFAKISHAIAELAKTIGLQNIQLFPISALLGDNVVDKSTAMPWYKGPSLLSWLEKINNEVIPTITTLRLPVQMVVRQDGSSSDDFRGLLGTIVAGTLHIGQTVRVLPQGLTSTISEIYVPQMQKMVDSALVGHAVAIRLADDLDVTRGDILVSNGTSTNSQPKLSKNIQANLCWLDNEALSINRKYMLRHTSNTVQAKIKSINTVLDIKTLSHGSGKQTMNMNDIGKVQITLQSSIVADCFDDCVATGSFILTDPVTHHTVAAGMIISAD